MACLRKRKLIKGDVWVVDFYKDGKRHVKSTGSADKRVAEKVLKKIEGDLVMGKFEIANNNQNKVKLKDFIEKYLEYSKSNKANKTYLLDRQTLNNFMAFVGNKNLLEINNYNVEKYKTLRLETISKTSINIELRHLKAAFSMAVKWGFIQKNPVKGVKQLKLDSRLPTYLELNEIEKFLNMIDNIEYKRYFQFLLYTGCRRKEALDLTWDEVDLKKRQIVAHAEKTKSSRMIPINDKLYDILCSIKGEGNKNKLFRFQGDTVTHAFQKYIKKSDIKRKLSLHSLRHTFASHLVMNGVDLYTIQKLLGHSNISVTSIYSHLAPDYLKLSVQKLPF